jgi:hypothetical protein
VLAEAFTKQRDLKEIETVLHDKLGPTTKWITSPAITTTTNLWKNHRLFSDSLQVFLISNGDLLTGCYPLKPVRNIMKDSLEIRRECPGCTCGVESSLAMKRAVSSTLAGLCKVRTATIRHSQPGFGTIPGSVFVAAVSSSSYLLLKNTQVTPIQMRKTPAHRWPVTRSPRKNFPPNAPAT